MQNYNTEPVDDRNEHRVKKDRLHHYEIESVKYRKIKPLVRKPRFQRNYVWKKEQQKELADTLFMNLPYGVLTVYEDQNDGTISIIDGLQRFTTMMQIERQIFHYMELVDGFYECLKEERGIDFEKTVSDVAAVLGTNVTTAKKEIRTAHAMCIDEKFDRDWKSYMQDALVGRYADSEEQEKEMRISLSAPVHDLNVAKDFFIDFDELRVHIIRLKQFDLAIEAFKRLNRTGTKISKYGVYAAAWNNSQSIQIRDRRFLEGICEYYNSGGTLENQKTGIGFAGGEVSAEQLASTGITAYECMLGVSAMIEKSSALYMTRQQMELVSSIGFLVFASVAGKLTQQGQNRMDEVILQINRNGQLADYINGIREAAELVSEILASYCMAGGTLYGNRKKRMAVAMITTAFRCMYDVGDGYYLMEIAEKYRKHFIDRMKKCLPARYLLDSITNRWSGSTDSTMREILTVPMAHNEYLNPVSREDMERALTAFLSADREHTRTGHAQHIQDSQKILLAFLSNIRGRKDPESAYNLYGTKLSVCRVIPRVLFQQSGLGGIFNESCTENLMFSPKDKAWVSNGKWQVPALYSSGIPDAEKRILACPPDGEVSFAVNRMIPAHEMQEFLSARSRQIVDDILTVCGE